MLEVRVFLWGILSGLYNKYRGSIYEFSVENVWNVAGAEEIKPGKDCKEQTIASAFDKAICSDQTMTWSKESTSVL